MRSLLERSARRWWAGTGRGAPAIVVGLLAPLSWLWRAVTAVRNARYDRSGAAVSVPGLHVVSVGNLAVGGTGKTPVAAWIARYHRARGRTVAVLLSGYARDEVLLHRRWAPDLTVIADRDRVAAARRAHDHGAGVAVLDDGFQHRRLARTVDIVLLAAEVPFPGRLMPLGPYREPPSALERATAVVITRRTASEAEARAFAERIEAGWPGRVKACARLVGGSWADLRGVARRAPEGDVLAVAGVGRPEEFGATVRALLPGNVQIEAFSDHHEYSRNDVAGIVRRAAGRSLVVTEKDAVKLVEHEQLVTDACVLRQAVEWDWGEAAVAALLEAGVGDAP